jgi:hypothetical protein
MLDQIDFVEFDGKTYTYFHGSPFDRGTADSYYGRSEDPHWWPEGTGNGTRVEIIDMTNEEIEDYYAGYAYNEYSCNKKNWE